MEVTNVKLVDKAPIICSFDIKSNGFILRELRLMQTNGSKWVAFPSRSYEHEGKKKYFAYIGIEQQFKEQFDKRCIELLSPFLVKKEPEPVQEECPF